MTNNLAFFTVEPTKDNKGYLGAMLVTNDLGMPEEFRVTYPVKPTLLQRQLYGDSLMVHIGVTLCGLPLQKALKTKPEIYLVSDRRFLPLADEIQAPVVQIERLGEAFAVGTSSDTSPLRKKIQSKSGRFQPLSVLVPASFEETRQQQSLSALERHFQTIDLIEPFERIKGALQALEAQDERFR